MRPARLAGITAVMLVASGVASFAVPQAAREPLPAEAVTTELDTDFFVGIRPSRDGQWLAFDVSDGRESLSYEYPNQSFTHTGFSMWSSLAIYRLRLLNVATGQWASLGSASGIRWGGSWSPDGHRYAYYSDESGMAAVWVWDRDTGAAKQVSRDMARTFRNIDAPLWTNDGQHLIFKTLPEGTTIDDYERMSPDFRRAQPKSADAAASREVKVNVYGAPADVRNGGPVGDDWFFDYRYLADVVEVGLADGVVTRLARRVRPLYLALSPDGKTLGAVNLVGMVPNTQKLEAQLATYSLDTRASRVLGDVVPADPPRFSWSPDSERIAYATHEGATWDTPVSYVVQVKNGRKTQLTAELKEAVHSLRWGAPLWSRDGRRLYVLDTPEPGSIARTSHLWSMAVDGSRVRELAVIEGRRIDDIVRSTAGNTYWSPDGGASMVVRTHALGSKQEGIYSVDTDSGVATRLTEDDVYIRKTLSGADGDLGHVPFFQEDAGHAVEVHSLDLRSHQVKRLSVMHPSFATIPLGRTSLVRWTSERGESLQGTLLLPPGEPAARPPPLVVWVYGGSQGSDALNRFGFGWGPMFNMQMLATRGYAVLFPDVPMHPGTPTDDVVGAVIPALDALVEQKRVDPERIAVMGQSFGGYCTLALITHSQRFKAAVITGSAPVNLFEGYTHFIAGGDLFGYYERGQGGMGGTPWEMPVRYFENSPAFFLDKVHTPLLIERGTTDVLSEMSGSVFNGLKRLGQRVELLEYEQEGHELQKPVDLVDFWNRRIEWLGAYLH